MHQPPRRVFWIIVDSLGVGELPDAIRFGDAGANTLRSVIECRDTFRAPVLQRLGLANVLDHIKWPRVERPLGLWGKMAEVSPGKDTTTGHWEMAGVPLDFAFPVFPNGFDSAFMKKFVKQTGVPGFLGNCPASGTEIIQRLGDEHVRTGKPIVYTSGDSVFQIACHEESFGLERLYETCKIARRLCDDLQVGRVIARPFIGKSGAYTRTHNRHDYSVNPPRETILGKVQAAGLEVIGVGKIGDIFNHLGITREIPSRGNENGMDLFTELASDHSWSGVAMINLVDFDSLYGHRRDSVGYANALEQFDQRLGGFLPLMADQDMLLLSADHGCDPRFMGTDHTREYVPILCYRPGKPGGPIGVRNRFSDVSATIADFFGLENPDSLAESFLNGSGGTLPT